MVRPEITDLITKAADAAAKATAEAVAEELYSRIRGDAERDQEDLFDRRLYNTKLLLEHYRSFKEHAEHAVAELSEYDEEKLTAIQIMDSMLNRPVGRGEAAVASIRNSVLRTYTVLRHIDEMLRIYHVACEASGRPEDLRKWDVVYALYIDDASGGIGRSELVEELAAKHCISERQVYRDCDDAIVRLTALLFGIDGIRLSSKGRKAKA